MMSLQSRSQPRSGNNRSIITMIALALFGVFWTSINGKLNNLDARLRCVEQQNASIMARIGIEVSRPAVPQTGPDSTPAGPQAVDPPGPGLG